MAFARLLHLPAILWEILSFDSDEAIHFVSESGYYLACLKNGGCIGDSESKSSKIGEIMNPKDTNIEETIMSSQSSYYRTEYYINLTLQRARRNVAKIQILSS